HVSARQHLSSFPTRRSSDLRTEYALTKHAAEQSLKALDLDWVILRPSLVYAEGSHGGTSLLRALAAFPWITFLPGNGEQPFQPRSEEHTSELQSRSDLVCRL